MVPCSTLNNREARLGSTAAISAIGVIRSSLRGLFVGLGPTRMVRNFRTETLPAARTEPAEKHRPREESFTACDRREHRSETLMNADITRSSAP
jgi:hypothetical protein